MAIQATGVKLSLTNSAASLNADVPVAAQAGDLLLAMVISSDSLGSGYISTPAGWTALVNGQQAIPTPKDVYVQTFFRYLSDPPEAFYNFASPTGARDWQVIMVSLAGVLQADPEDISGVSSGSSVTITAPSVDTTDRNALLLQMYWMFGGSGATFTPAGSLVSSGFNASLGAWRMESRVRPNIGATGAASATIDSTQWVGIQIALRPTNLAPYAAVHGIPHESEILQSNVDNDFTWIFTDPDPGDTLQKSDLRYRIVGAPGWTDVLNILASGTTISSGTFAVGDYEWQVRNYDQDGLVGPYSGSRFFSVVTVPADPTITYPVDSTNVLATEVMTWTAPSQTNYQVRRVADNAGVPNTGVVYYDSGTVADADARSHPLTFPVEGRVEHVQARVQVAGLWSGWDSVKVTASYTPPPEPALILTSDTVIGRMIVNIINPAPGGLEPAVAYNDIYRSEDGGDFIRIATNSPPNLKYDDYTTRSEGVYEYRVIAVATVNNTTKASLDYLAPAFVLEGTWMQDPTNLGTNRDTIHQFLYNDNTGNEQFNREHELMEFAGRVDPVLEYGTGEDYSLTLNLALEDVRGDEEALRLLHSQEAVLLLRDSRGRKMFFAMPDLNITPRPWGARTSLTLRRVDRTEEV